MTTISDRASALVRETPRDPTDLNRLREEWRVIAKQWAEAKDRAERLEEQRKILLAELTMVFMKDGMAHNKAEISARTSQQFRNKVEELYSAKREANDLWIDTQNADRIYWERNNQEATERSERRMSR